MNIIFVPSLFFYACLRQKCSYTNFILQKIFVMSA